MLIKVEENLIDQTERNSTLIEKEIENFIETNEGLNIKADIESLKNMGFDKTMINKVYILLRPENIERAIDYMSELKGIYQHNFVANNNQKEIHLCFICKKPKNNHLDYIPNDLSNKDMNVNPNINNELNMINNVNNLDNNNECQVCYEEIKEENKILNRIACGHLFCSNCWFNYLKALILEAKVDNIKCMDYECNEYISEEFIFKHISKNENLVEKFQEFKKRVEIIKNKNKKICPNPDCDSFIQISKSSKYVQCENGHKYCFECLKPPHGDKSCDFQIEKQFMKWTKGKRVKRCPRCQMYTEKNEGCNHMTCVCCKYEWCWICEKKYIYGHYDSGKCAGQQFTKADNLEEVEKNQNYFGLHRIFPCVFNPVGRRIEFDEYWKKYLLILGFWIIGISIIFVYIIFSYIVINIPHLGDSFAGIISLFIAFNALIAFQIPFTCLITPFILISFIYPKFFDRILLFFEVGDD